MRPRQRSGGEDLNAGSLHPQARHCAGPAACGIIILSTNPAKPKLEAAMKQRSLVAFVVPGTLLPAAAGARNGSFVRN
jgi:hypothetical protein